MDQHWIGVNLFHLILISNLRKLKRNIDFTCLHTCWMWCVLAKNTPLLDGNRSSTFRQFMFTTKILWENKYKEDYELIWNGIFSKIYQVLFGEEAPCLSPKGKKIVKEYGDWYMTPDRVYIRISDNTKASHWFPHLVPNTLLLQEISYETYVNGVPPSLHRDKKGCWPSFPLLTKVCKIENFKQAKDEVGILDSFKFR